ncbi:response regulator [Oleiharenicola lentus]|uniref:response regulator n=1 Tax=Oleiharenicola lentus TaxID=2508720 RepID=UPI003F6728CB
MSRGAHLLKILLVEDSEDDAFFFHRLIKKSGLNLETSHASNGLAAIEMLKPGVLASDAHKRPDLVLLDLKMPDYDGFDVLAWVQNSRFQPPLKIAVLSGSEDETDILKAKNLGAIACFAKPMQLGQLRALLANCGLEPAPSQPVLP